MEKELVSAWENVDGTILHIGAGECSELEAYQRTEAQRIVLVEPRPEAVRVLRDRTAGNERIEIVETAVGRKSGSKPLYYFNIPQLASLNSIKEPPERWPGLQVVEKRNVSVTDLPQLLKSLSLDSKRGNWLIIEAHGEEESLLQALALSGLPQLFSYVSLHIVPNNSDFSRTVSMLRRELESAGYRLEHTATQLGVVLHSRADERWLESKDLLKKLTALDQEQKNASTDLSNALKKILKAQENISEKLSEAGSFARCREKIQSQTKKDILSGVKQIEAYLGIQSFFNDWKQVPSMHGWPVSPDFGLYLIRIIEKKNYDLIIEFGSGSSTVLIAEAISKIKSSLMDSTFPTQVAFEHLEEFYNKTRSQLKESGHEKSVQLELSPLAEFIDDKGNSYSYYSCEKVLFDVFNSIVDPFPKILVVVDGPPGSTGRHARFPALPVVLRKVKTGTIDVLLDDFARKEEDEVVGMWEEYIKNSNFDYERIDLDFEKGGCMLRISAM